MDSNVFLELLLDQERADEVETFIKSDAPVYLTELSLYSIGIILLHRKLHKVFLRFVDDLLVKGGVDLVRLQVEDLQAIAEVSGRFGLDFDDAYQYVAATVYGYTLISFDSDFDKTDLIRKVPSEVLAH